MIVETSTPGCVCCFCGHGCFYCGLRRAADGLVYATSRWQPDPPPQSLQPAASTARRRPPWPEERAPAFGDHVPRLHVALSHRPVQRLRRPNSRGQGLR